MDEIGNVEGIVIKYEDETYEEPIKKEKRLWIRDALVNRDTEGEFAVIYKDLERDSKKFESYFRMSKKKFYELLILVEPWLIRKSTTLRKSIPPIERLAVLLRYLATGESFSHLAKKFRMGTSTVSTIVSYACAILWEVLPPLIAPPPTEVTWLNAESLFRTRLNFPNCVGVLSGREILVNQPGTSTHRSKRYFTVVLLGVFDPDSRFIIADVGGYDAEEGIFQSSQIGCLYTEGQLHLPPDKPLPDANFSLPHVIVTTDAFPLKRNLIGPYRVNQQDNVKRRYFNEKVDTVQTVADKAFDMLGKKFGIFHQRLQLTPKYVSNIIMATVLLHNFLIDDTVTFDDDDFFIESDALCSLEGCRGPRGSNFDVRDKFASYFEPQAESSAMETINILDEYPFE